MMNVEEIRLYCLSKPMATEDMPFGPDYVCFRVGGKIFAGLSFMRDSVLQMKCTPDFFDEVTARYPYVNQAWHWHKRHWIEINLEQVAPDDVVTSLIDNAYTTVVAKLPKRVVNNLGIKQ